MFQERYIQNPGIFRTRSIFKTRCIFRTLSQIYDGMFCKTQLPSELSGLSPQTFSQKRFLKFFPKNTCSEKVYIFSQNFFSNFLETELSYI